MKRGHIYMIFFCNKVLNLTPFFQKTSNIIRQAIMRALLCFTCFDTYAQKIVLDRPRLNIVSSNGAVRNGAEAAHNNYLGNIKSKIDNINVNASSVVLAQQIIYNGLSQVNSALKDGIAVKNMAVITADILHYLDQALLLARSDPALLLVANNMQANAVPAPLCSSTTFPALSSNPAATCLPTITPAMNS
jgi:predicted nucleotide-binding protein (sugar kinase/HSP70/actin superfamily)